ncbi:MAG TPA: helix-turn-helix transcriptional regulator [Candidatus Acidoferrum sp.]|jgi:AraC-like DNA-binding protein|nr:helix-turn-helix transcriptional regulator [Candidatus Acidoferrum sp.]
MHAQQYRVKSEKRPACKASDKLAPKSRLAQILRKVESGSLRTVSELSLEFNLSPAYIQRIFKQQTGVRLGAVLAEQRLAKAADLLANSYLSVKEIAHAVGYEHASSFVRAFQRRFTQPPGSYRQHAEDRKS